MDPVETVLKHSGFVTLKELKEKALKHYGVPGMKWGVRKSSAPSGPSEVTVSTKTGKKGDVKIVTKGGKGQPPSEDAVAAAVAIQKARGSSTASLSNAEMRAAVDRMQLETKYSDLAAKRALKQANPATAFVKTVLVDLAKDDVRNLAKGNDTRFLGELLGSKGSGTGGKHKQR